MKMTTSSVIGSVAIGGISTLALAFGSVDRAQAAAISLFNTGVDGAGNVLADGASESHYTLTSVPGGTSSLIARTSVGGFPIPPWLGNNTTSAWIGPSNASDLDGPIGQYTYRTTFDLSSFIASTASITGRWSADNAGLDILLNGVSLGLTNGGFTGFSPDFTISSGFATGNNTLDFVVRNDGGPTGVRVELSGIADAASVPEPSDMLGTAIAFGSIVMLKRKLTKKTLG
jgi:hypothetical protein